MSIQAGRYPGKPTGVASVYENDKHSLVLCMEISVEGETLKWFTTLATEKDGINTKTIDRLKACFGWNGVDPFWFVDSPDEYKEREVEVTIEMRAGTKNPEKFFPSIQYVDPPGGGAGAMPETGNRSALLAKYGSKFRAISGGAPAAPKAATAKKAAPKAAPAAPAEASTQDECWRLFCAKNEGKGEDALADAWFALLAKEVPGVDQGDFTPAQWGKVKKAITDDLPY